MRGRRDTAFRPVRNNDLILGAVGQLQFEVVAFRLQDEYGVQCAFEAIGVQTARWVQAARSDKLAEFRSKAHDNLAVDHSGALVYLAPSRVNLGADAGALAGSALPRDPRESGYPGAVRAWLARGPRCRGRCTTGPIPPSPPR